MFGCLNAIGRICLMLCLAFIGVLLIAYAVDAMNTLERIQAIILWFAGFLLVCLSFHVGLKLRKEG